MKQNHKLILSSLLILSLSACTEQAEVSSESVVEEEAQVVEAVESNAVEMTKAEEIEVEIDSTTGPVIGIGEQPGLTTALNTNDSSERVVDQITAERTTVESALVEKATVVTAMTEEKVIAQDGVKSLSVNDAIDQSSVKKSLAAADKPVIASTNDVVTTEEVLSVESKPVFVPQSGSWVKKSQSIRGQWRIEQRGSDAYLVLDDDFKTRKAPDLKFVLSKRSTDDASNKNAMQGAKLVASLKSVTGSQAYKLPADYTSYQSLLLHCEKYTKLWGAARLK